MKLPISLLAALVAALLAAPSLAAVTAEQAAQLKTTLTPMGAEKAGDPTHGIPDWTGGYTTVPAGFKAGSVRPDFFADEQPLYTVDAKNMGEYADTLTDGVKALLKKYPDFKLEVYPSHRSAAAPQWVYDNTFQNATRAKLIDNGFGVEGAYGGVPFPIPQNGNEVMWNHRLSWQGESHTAPARAWMSTADGHVSLVSAGQQINYNPYYQKNGDLKSFSGFYQLGRYVQSAPASKAGEAILAQESINSEHERGIWQYLVGQRRVRRAPAVAYDTPDSVTSGIGFFDEAFMQFGPFEHHAYKLVGKKAILVPYNNNRAVAAKSEDLVGKHFLNPELVRWELHRVWEVDATLAPGKRHVVATRKFYVDEDSWRIILIDGWDADGKLWRSTYTLTLLAPDVPALYGDVNWGTYDLRTGAYFINSAANGTDRQATPDPRLTSEDFSPATLANLGAR